MPAGIRKEVYIMKKRYWLNLGCWDEGYGGLHIDEMVGKRIRALDSNIMDQDEQLVLKTDDLEQAKKVRAEAWKIVREYGFYDPPDEAEEIMSITVQPQCPECGMLGRFSDRFCAKCGVPLEGGQE